MTLILPCPPQIYLEPLLDVEVAHVIFVSIALESPMQWSSVLVRRVIGQPSWDFVLLEPARPILEDFDNISATGFVEVRNPGTFGGTD